MASGIYQIKNLVNDKIYIGSAVSLLKRQTNHFSDLTHKRHANIHLQRAHDKYGKENFTFEILFICPEEDLIRLEQYCINNYEPEYNICRVAGSSLGLIRSEETKIKQRARKHTEESKLKMSISAKDKIISLETRQKMSNAQKGKKKTAEHIRKVRLGSIKPVLQFCKTTNVLINEFESISLAGENLKINISDISACCKYKRKTAGGFKWKYKNEIQCP